MPCLQQPNDGKTLRISRRKKKGALGGTPGPQVTTSRDDRAGHVGPTTNRGHDDDRHRGGNDRESVRNANRELRQVQKSH
jgi:hypothetical protein